MPYVRVRLLLAPYGPDSGSAIAAASMTIVFLVLTHGTKCLIPSIRAPSYLACTTLRGPSSPFGTGLPEYKPWGGCLLSAWITLRLMLLEVGQRD